MAFTQFGNTSYKFGFSDDDVTLAASLGIKIQKISDAIQPEFTAEARDENGIISSRVVAQDQNNLTISGFLFDEATFDAAVSFSRGSDFYVIIDKKKDSSNVEYRQCEITAIHNGNITS